MGSHGLFPRTSSHGNNNTCTRQYIVHFNVSSSLLRFSHPSLGTNTTLVNAGENRRSNIVYTTWFNSDRTRCIDSNKTKTILNDSDYWRRALILGNNFCVPILRASGHERLFSITASTCFYTKNTITTDVLLCSISFGMKGRESDDFSTYPLHYYII